MAWAGKLRTRKDVETSRSVFVTRASAAEVDWWDCPLCTVFLAAVMELGAVPEFKLVLLLPILILKPLLFVKWLFKLAPLLILLLPIPLSKGLLRLAASPPPRWHPEDGWGSPLFDVNVIDCCCCCCNVFEQLFDIFVEATIFFLWSFNFQTHTAMRTLR